MLPELLAVAYAEGGRLLKFGGDALLILFTGDDHEARGVPRRDGHARGPARDRPHRRLGPRVSLRMSVGVHSGAFLLFLVGGFAPGADVAGPAATTVVEMEAPPTPGEIVVSPATAAALPPGVPRRGEGPGRAPADAHRRAGSASMRDPPAPPRASTPRHASRRLRDSLLAGRSSRSTAA